MATKQKIVEPKVEALPAFVLQLPVHVDEIDINNMDCQTRDALGSALGCNFQVREGLLFAADGRAFKVERVGRELRFT